MNMSGLHDMNTLGLQDLKPVRLQGPVADDAMNWLA